jgi:hypothetical protein
MALFDRLKITLGEKRDADAASYMLLLGQDRMALSAENTFFLKDSI